ncbi:MAG: peptidylprolyl isomerase [Candidatus Komeilibacteria bacterium]|nr:peptidylprolyl isomerase [Candidatus Komeilibacteria bacterium]
MVVNNFKKIKVPEATQATSSTEASPATPVKIKKTVKAKPAKTAKKTVAAPIKAKLSPKNKKAIEKSYQEKIQAAIKELPVESVAEAKNDQPVKPVKQPAPVKAKAAPIVSEVTSEPKAVLDTESIRNAVLAELKTSVSTSPVKKEKKTILPVLSSLPQDRRQPVRATLPVKQIAAEPVEKVIESPSKIHIHIGGKRIFSVHHPKILIKPLTSLVVGLILIILVSLAGVYLGSWDNPAIQKVYGALPLPAVYVDGRIISLGDFYEDTTALLAYQKRLGLLSSRQEAKQQIIKSLVEKSVIASLAKAKGLTVEPAEVDQELNFIIASSGSSAELEKMVGDLYGWNLSQYKEKIIRPLLFAQKVMNDFNLTGGNAEIKKNLQAKRQQVIDGTVEFSALAAEINEDDSKFSNGDLGWFKLGDILPEFEIQFLNLEAGELSQVFESSAGYHVVKLVEKTGEAGSDASYHLSQLFLTKVRFEDYLNEQIKKARVLTLIKI